MVQLEQRDGEDVRGTLLEDERVLEPNADDSPTLRPEPTRAGNPVSIEALQRPGDLGPARNLGVVQILSITCLTTV